MASLLLDENMPRQAGQVLAAAGHELLFVADVAAGISDAEVLALACDQGRILLTLDADFGDLIYQQHRPAPLAIVYLRAHPIDGAQIGALAAQALLEPLEGHFVVCTLEGQRKRRLPVP